MGNINLSEEEKQKLLQALNEESEPAAELAKKLFPGLFARLQDESRFDVRSLQRAKIPTIEYEGKRSAAAILNSAALFGGQSPLQVVRCFEEGRLNKKTDQLMLIKESSPAYEAGWRNLIVQGDNLQFLKTCYLNQDSLIKDKVKGKVRLIYIDPPFATQSDFAASEGGDSYADQIDRAEFIEQIRERLVFLMELLSPTGSIYVHLDYRMNHYIRTVLDEVFDRASFMSEIIWKRTSAHSDASTFGNVHDVILFYSFGGSRAFNPQYTEYSDEHVAKRYKHVEPDGRRYTDGDLVATGLKGGGYRYTWKGHTKTWRCPIETMRQYDKEGRLYYTREGLARIKRYLDEVKGLPVPDLWQDIFPVNSQAAERVDYPTQKPEALLERIISASSQKDDLIIDVFAGSGTAGAVAEKLGRRWVMCDFGKHAIYTMQKRMIEIGESAMLGSPVDKKKKQNYGEKPRFFCVLSVGAYDFSKIINLRENRDAYVNFVLEMFGISDRDGNYEKKYKLNDIYAEKDGDPVMVFPVWEDDYLKNVRIDEEYLKGLLDQTGGRLKGNVYIICPETCTTVSDTEFKNARNQKVTFRMLTFPYKVLEEVSRNFQIEEQPSSSDNINNLVSSVGFYFNQEVKLKVKKLNGGFEIKEFDTAVTDREGKCFDGLDGLAMMLVDADYDGEVFKINVAIYQKDIKNNKVTLKGLGPRSALIAIDKFGNESKIAMLK